MSDTLTGRTIGKYQIQEKLGRGGMAEVYKAYQENLDRTVAIKLMHAFLASEQDFLQRFKREARAMAAMNHPNIVGVYDFDVYKEDTYYLVMEYIAGGTLKQRQEELAEKQEGMPLEKSVQIGYQVAEALDYAHNQSMVHRDVKTANIMLDEDDKALLTDFGIVKMMGGQTMAYTVTGALIGTPSYMSPEQAMGEPGDKRVDIYALGVLLFQMTTGQLPYTADTPLAVIMKHVNEPVPKPVTFNPDVPPRLQDIILKAMEKDPENRYQTAAAMAKDLRAVQFDFRTQSAALIAGTTAVIPQMGGDTKPSPAKTAENTAQSMAAASATAFSAESQSSTPAFQSIPLPQQLPQQTQAAPVETAPAEKKRSPWLVVGIVLLLLILIGGTAVAFNIFSGNDEKNNEIAVITGEPATPTDDPTETPEPDDTPDTEATVAAAILLTQENRSTEEATEEATEKATAPPTKKPTATPKPTTNPTLAFLESCIPDVVLVNTYTYQNENFDAAPIGKTFPVNWILENPGACPWPDSLVWTFESGEEFGYQGEPIPVGALAAGEQEIITVDFTAPTRTGSFDSTWQLINSASGEPVGAPLEFTLKTYIDATNTPAPTNTPIASSTPGATATVEQPVDLIYVINDCEYIGDEYRCQVQITPYGGGGGPYTVFVFDADQPAEYRGNFPIYHFAKSRRCATYNNEVIAIDDATGTRISKQIFIDPNNYISGGCVLP